MEGAENHIFLPFACGRPRQIHTMQTAKKEARKKEAENNKFLVYIMYILILYIYTLTDISTTILTVAWRKEDEEDNAG